MARSSARCSSDPEGGRLARDEGEARPGAPGNRRRGPRARTRRGRPAGRVPHPPLLRRARRMTGGRLVARALAAAGIDTVFTLVGGHTTPVVDACHEIGVRLVDVRHEEAAGHMAHAWARVTGRTGVVLVTAGPGVTNTATAVANAWSGGAPLLVLGGGVPRAQLGRGALHEMDQLGLMPPITKRAASAHDPGGSAGATLARPSRRPVAVDPGPSSSSCRPTCCARTALNRRPGPRRASPPAAAPRTPTWRRPPACSPMPSARSWWPAAASTGPRRGTSSARSSSASVRRRSPHMPRVASSPSPTRSTCPPRAPAPSATRTSCSWPAPGFNFMLAYGQPPRFNAEARIIQIDVDPSAIGHNRSVAVGLVGDARTVLGQLVDRVDERSPGAWLGALRETDANARAALEAEAASGATPIHPLRLCRELTLALPEDAFVAADGGDILSFARQAVQVSAPGCWLDSGPFGCLGYGIASACAARLARPDRPRSPCSGTERSVSRRWSSTRPPATVSASSWSCRRTAHGPSRRPARRWSSVGPSRPRSSGGPTTSSAEALGCDGIEVTRPEELAPALVAPAARPAAPRERGHRPGGA